MMIRFEIVQCRCDNNNNASVGEHAADDDDENDDDDDDNEVKAQRVRPCLRARSGLWGGPGWLCGEFDNLS